MRNTLCLYLDDSGTRHPDKKQGITPQHGHDYFGIGGIIIDESQKSIYENEHDSFCQKWEISFPLHSFEIRHKTGNFTFLAGLTQERQDQFYEELYQLISNAPVRGTACVIDRPGYKSRYDNIYAENKWKLCKSAFSIVVERSAKIASREGKKLRVNIEHGDKKTNSIVKGYYNYLRTSGMPFSIENSSKYNPLSSSFLGNVLYDFKIKQKSSKLTQLADLYLWPICIGGYDKNNRTYKRFIEDKKLIDCFLSKEEGQSLGIKYYCWDLVDKKDKARSKPGFKSAISR